MICSECGSTDKVGDLKYLPTSTGGHITLAKRTKLCLKCAKALVRNTEEMIKELRK